MASVLVGRTLSCIGMMVMALISAGCAFGDRHAPIEYSPVMGIKAKAPATVDIRPFQSTRGLSDERQIGQVRNGYMTVTAKVFCENGDAMEWGAPGSSRRTGQRRIPDGRRGRLATRGIARHDHGHSPRASYGRGLRRISLPVSSLDS